MSVRVYRRVWLAIQRLADQRRLKWSRLRRPLNRNDLSAPGPRSDCTRPQRRFCRLRRRGPACRGHGRGALAYLPVDVTLNSRRWRGTTTRRRRSATAKTTRASRVHPTTTWHQASSSHSPRRLSSTSSSPAAWRQSLPSWSWRRRPKSLLSRLRPPWSPVHTSTATQRRRPASWSRWRSRSRRACLRRRRRRRGVVRRGRAENARCRKACRPKQVRVRGASTATSRSSRRPIGAARVQTHRTALPSAWTGCRACAAPAPSSTTASSRQRTTHRRSTTLTRALVTPAWTALDAVDAGRRSAYCRWSYLASVSTGRSLPVIAAPSDSAAVAAVTVPHHVSSSSSSSSSSRHLSALLYWTYFMPPPRSEPLETRCNRSVTSCQKTRWNWWTVDSVCENNVGPVVGEQC